MAKVELKKPIVDEIAAAVKDAQSVVLVDYRGLTVEQDTQLRKQLREADHLQGLQEHNDEFCIQGHGLRSAPSLSGRSQCGCHLYRGRYGSRESVMQIR